MKSAEEILDLKYANGMHWKTINRQNVLSAMRKYATACIKADRLDAVEQADDYGLVDPKDITNRSIELP